MEKKKIKQFLSIELDEDKAARFDVILERAKRRNPLSNKSHVIRELFGLTRYGIVTEEDKAYFRGEMEIPFPMGEDIIDDVSEPLMDRGVSRSEQPINAAQKRDISKVKGAAVEHARKRRRS